MIFELIDYSLMYDTGSIVRFKIEYRYEVMREVRGEMCDAGFDSTPCSFSQKGGKTHDKNDQPHKRGNSRNN